MSLLRATRHSPYSREAKRRRNRLWRASL